MSSVLTAVRKCLGRYLSITLGYCKGEEAGSKLPCSICARNATRNEASSGCKG